MRARAKILIVSGILATASVGAFATMAVADGPGRGHDGPFPGPGPIGTMLRQEMEQSGGKLTKEQADTATAAMFAKYDKNGDGKLSLEEYQAFWADMMHERMVRSFQFLDRGGDGLVTEAEFQAPVDWMMRRLDRTGDGAVSQQDFRSRDRDGRHGPDGRGHGPDWDEPD